MANENSLGEKRRRWLPFIILMVVYVLLKISSIKISFWVLVALAIVTIFFIVLSYKLKSLAPSMATTIEESLSSVKFQEFKSDALRVILVIAAVITLAICSRYLFCLYY